MASVLQKSTSSNLKPRARQKHSANGAPNTQTIPPLENGDRLTRAEFERRYTAMPHIKKAELIEGVVYMPSPVSHLKHSRPHQCVNFWLGTYMIGTPGVDVADNSTVKLDLDNEPQPDACLFVLPEHGGQVSFDDEGYINGSPELIVEVASSSVSYDLHDKFNSYRRNGVLEYVIWRVRDEEIDWFVLREGEYKWLEVDADGKYHSEAFPGLVLDTGAMLAGDLRRVSDVQRKALKSSAHKAFVKRLHEAAK